jgi:hypothetical protein
VASDLTHPDTARALAPGAPTPPPAPELGAAHRARFVVIYGILAAVVVGAIAGTAIYAGRTISPAPAWSSWKPSGGGQGAAKQIAEHVAKSYRLPNGNQLVDVFAKAPSVSPSSNQTIPIHYVVVRGGKTAGDQQMEITSTNSVMYSLCGLGASCSIASGAPSVERGTLVRREILELALYTFKYVDGIQHVIAFMPPQPGKQPQYVIYLRKSDLAEKLKLPLQETLAKKVPLPKSIPASEVRTIDATTEPRVYNFSLSQTQNGDAVFVFAPLA